MPKCDFNKVAVTLLKSHFGMGVLLYICCIFSEHLFLRTPLDGCLWIKQYNATTICSCKICKWANFRVFCKGTLLDFASDVGWVWEDYLTSLPLETIRKCVIFWWFQRRSGASLVCVSSFHNRRQIWQRILKPCIFCFVGFIS